MSRCLTFRIFSLLQLNCWLLGVIFFPIICLFLPHVLHWWYAHPEHTHPHQLYRFVSLSFKMYLHTELNITFMPLLSTPLPPPRPHIYALPQCFHVSFFSPSRCSVAIGIGFYGNSEANDGMYQLTSSLLTANYTLASIDLLVSDALHK